ncbi:outer membrane autotransporter barrel domain-containing protein [Burkholderia sp. GAS332]|nr:outer membrane autotransporter barrel domain-containing protein [Burkholderia sp. GAS332]
MTGVKTLINPAWVTPREGNVRDLSLLPLSTRSSCALRDNLATDSLGGAPVLVNAPTWGRCHGKRPGVTQHNIETGLWGHDSRVDGFVIKRGVRATSVALAFAASAAHAQATIDNVGGSGCMACATGLVTVNGDQSGNQASPWNVGGALTIGNQGRGELNISSGGTVSDTNAVIGSAASGTGTVKVDGTTGATTWTNSGVIYAGYNGTGTLNITSGGAVSAAGAFVGYSAGSTGAVTVGGAGSTWADGSSLYVGYNSAGTLNITAGGTVSSGGAAVIGNTAGVTGTVTVDGTGSNWTATGNLIVGYLGIGTLNVTNGGKASNIGSDFIGNSAGGTGTVTVDGTGSTWTNTSGLGIGVGGTGTLTISDGGIVSAQSGVGIAQNAGSTGTLIIGAAAGQPAVAPGTLTTRTVAFGVGTGDIVFNHTDTSGNYTFAAIISGTGAVDVYSGTTALTANNTYTGTTTIHAGTLQLGNGGTSGSVVGDITDNGTLAFDRSNTVTFGGAITGSGAVNQIGTGTTVLTGTGTYSGPTTVAGGKLAAGGANVFSPNSDYTVQAGSTLALQGNRQTVAGLANAGLVTIGASTAPGTVLTTTNYVGQGGTIALNTFLGDDSSPSDRLVINGGTATGTTTLAFTNVGGPGAHTTANGIPVVQAINGATAGVGAFTQAAGELRGGFYDYRLFQGGLGGSDPNDWFLRSEFVVPGAPSIPGEPPVGPGGPPVTPVLPEIPILPLDPPPAVLPPGVYPIIGPEIATYSVVQPVARQLGLTTLGTMHERIGDTLTPVQGGAGNAGWGPSGWVRLFGQQIDNRYQTFTDARASGSLLGFQSGVDLWRGSFLPGHHDTTGVYFAYGNSSVDVDGLVTNAPATAYVLNHTGSVDLDAYSGGAYWTHYGPGGWYLDAVFQGTYYDGHASTEFARLPVSGSGFVTSLEGGYPVPLPLLGPGFVLEPQAQVIWQHVGLNETNDGLGPVDLGSTSGVSGRLGVRGQWTIGRANGQVWQPYVRANLWRDWGAQATATYSAVDQVPVAGQATRMELAAGVTAKLDARMSVYSQYGYQFSLNSSAGGSRKGMWGDIGVRYLW